MPFLRFGTSRCERLVVTSTNEVIQVKDQRPKLAPRNESLQLALNEHCETLLRSISIRFDYPDLPQNLWVEIGRRDLNCSVFLDADQQPSLSGRQKRHDFKRRWPDTSVHVFVLSRRRARAQSAAADGARARNRLKNCTGSMTPRHHRISSTSESSSRQSVRGLIRDR